MDTRVSSPRRSSVAGAASMLSALLAVMASAVARESEIPSLVVAPVGGVAILRAFPSVPGFHYSWYRNGQKIPGESGRRRLLPNGGLQLVGLRRGDAGAYRSRATDERVHVRRDITLNVTDPVELAANIVGELNATVMGELGRPLSIECLAYGHPEPMIMWKHRHKDHMFFVNGKQYTLSGNELLIKALDVASLGEYSCNVYNGISKPVSWSVVVRAFRLDNSSSNPYLIERSPTNVTEHPDIQVSSPQPTTGSSKIPISTDACSKTYEQGPCLNYTAYWFYDMQYGGCSRFWYGGCEGNGNRFATKEDCEDVCVRPPDKEVCQLPKAIGGCSDSQPRWYFDKDHGLCMMFDYGGCLGNANNFETRELCKTHCELETNEDADICQLPGERGSCMGSFSRWYFDAGAGRCEQFTWGGCGGSANRFDSEAACLLRCRPSGDLRHSSNEIIPAKDCRQQTKECNAIQCPYVFFNKDADGCTICSCLKHPCEDKECPAGRRCTVDTDRDPITDDVRYTAVCRIVNKPGVCPAAETSERDGDCRSECNDDADCLGVRKCCLDGCSQRCLVPEQSGVPSPTPSPLYPDAPQVPQPNPETEKEVSSEEGGMATLRCLFHSNPPPKISWRRGEITIDGDAGRYRLTADGALQIVSLFRDDSGAYICVAENELGSASQEVLLLVNDPKEIPAGIAGEPSADVIGEIGRPLSIRCLVYGYPEPTIYWYRGPTGPLVPYDSKIYKTAGNVLLIRALDIEALGEYTCQAYNGIKKPASWTVVVRAQRRDPSWPASQYLLERAPPVPRPAPASPAAPARPSTPPIVELPDVPVYTVPVRTELRAAQTTLAAGAELSLPCEIDGYPEPNVYWTKDGLRLEESDRIHMTAALLTVSGVTTDDSGEYGCHASNGHSSHQSTVRIEVTELDIPAQCTDNQYFANCQLIVLRKFCNHIYYSSFCCKSCVEAGQLDPQKLQLQASPAWARK